MKHIFSLSLIFLFSYQLTGQDIECAEQIAYQQDVIADFTVASDLYPSYYYYTADGEQQEAEGVVYPQFALEDFILDDLQDINTICFPGAFLYFNGGPDLRGNNNSSYRTDICEPYTKTFEVIYYQDYPELPTNLSSYIYAGPFNVTPTAEHIVGTPYYQFTGMHDVVNFPLNTTFWVSIQNIDDEGDFNCEFQLLYSDIDNLQSDRSNINTRNLGGGFWVVPNFGGQPSFIQGCINFTLGATGLAPIPTLSQWGIIILGLLVIVFGVSYVRKEQLDIA